MNAEKMVNVLTEASTTENIDKVVNGVSKAAELVSVLTTRQSITNLSKDSLLQFPILIENNVSEPNLVILNKALEHEFISFIVLALNNIIVNKIEANGTVGELLKKIHTNVDLSAKDNLSNYSSSIKSVLNDSMNEIQDAEIESVLIEDTTYEELKKYNEMCVLHPVGEELNESILNHSSFPEIILNEVADKPGTALNVRVSSNDSIKTFTIDYKKLNMLAPTIVKCKVKFTLVTDAKNKKTGQQITRAQETELVFGVKTVLHPIETDDFINTMNDVYKSGKFPVRLVKFLTGELKARDFIFNVAEAKKRAKQTYGGQGGSYWWNKLEDLAKQDKAMKVARSVSSNKDVTLMTAVTTFVVTKSSALRIKNKLGQNIFERPEIIDEIFNRFFIMGFMVIDEPSNHLYIYDPNRHDYKVVSLSSLKAIAREEIGIKDGEPTLFDR